MENHPVYQYYKNYIKINGKEFLWTDISVSSGKRIIIDNINDFYRPVLQYLGPRETNFSISIKYGGIYKASDSNKNINSSTEVENNNSKNSLKDSFLEQKNFIQDLINTEKSKNVEIELPDGDIVHGVLQNRTKTYFSLGLNNEQLDFIMLYPEKYSYTQISPNKIYDIKTDILNNVKSELISGEIPVSFMDKIKNSKTASWLSKSIENVKSIYKTFRKYSNLVKQYITRVQNILSKVQDIANSFVSVFQEPLRILNLLKDINTQLVNIAKTPGRIVDTMQQICDGVSVYFNNTKNTFNFMFSMFDFTKTNNDKLVEYYNINKIQQEIMESEVRDTSNIVFFTNALINSIEIEYDTDEEISQTILKLDKMYEYLINNNNISDNTKDLLFNGFNETKAYLLNNASSKKNIKYITVSTPKTLHKIVFEYYGDDSLYDEILLLNKDTIKDVLNVRGLIKIFN